MTDTVVTFGEIMLRLSPPGFRRFSQAAVFEATFGGGEANVAASLAAFGIPVDFVTRLPANEIADAALSFLNGLGVSTRYVIRGGDRLGIYFAEAGAAQRGGKVLYDRADSAMATIDAGMIDWRSVLAGAAWFHTTGITPALSAGAARAAIEGARSARASGLRVSVDLNFRAKLWNWGERPTRIMSELVAEADVLFGNEEDADKVFGIRGGSSRVEAGIVEAEEYEDVCQALRARFPNLSVVALTMRESRSASHNSWSAVSLSDQGFHASRTYDIWPIVDRVGAGDAFAAGMIFGLGRDCANVGSALEFAVAASCLKHSIPGDVNRVSIAEADALVAGNVAGRISR